MASTAIARPRPVKGGGKKRRKKAPPLLLLGALSLAGAACLLLHPATPTLHTLAARPAILAALSSCIADKGGRLCSPTLATRVATALVSGNARAAASAARAGLPSVIVSGDSTQPDLEGLKPELSAAARRLSSSVGLAEPFERIRLAIDEAQQIHGAGGADEAAAA